MKQNENNPWLDEIRDEILDFQAEIPANGWERVSSALPDRNRYVLPGRWWAVAASVLLCLALGGGYLLYQAAPEEMVQDSMLAQEVPESADNPEWKDEETVDEEVPVKQNVYVVHAHHPAHRKVDSVIQDTTQLVASVNAVASVIDVEDIAEEPQDRDTVVTVRRDIDVNEPLWALNQSEASAPTKSHWTVGLHVGGHGSLLDLAQSGDFMSGPGHSQNDPYHGSGSTGNPSIPATDDVTSSDHHLSFSFGLSAGKEIYPQTFLETGVVYTLLMSDVNLRYSGEALQRIQYIGIPLRVNYTLASGKSSQFYVGGGVMLEHVLSAKREEKRIAVKPWQWSSNLSVGLQTQIARKMSLYLEPGVSWYFSTDKNVPTLRSESPAYFNLKAGIRFSY